jgi:hypothetical protein
VRKLRALHRFRKERRRSTRDCFECSDTTHFIADCTKRKKFDSSNKYNYNNRSDSSDKGVGKKKYRFRDKMNKKFQKMMPRACAALSDLELLVFSPLIHCLDLIWRLLPLRLKILSTNLITLLATLFYPLLVKHVYLSMISFLCHQREHQASAGGRCDIPPLSRDDQS